MPTPLKGNHVEKVIINAFLKRLICPYLRECLQFNSQALLCFPTGLSKALHPDSLSSHFAFLVCYQQRSLVLKVTVRSGDVGEGLCMSVTTLYEVKALREFIRWFATYDIARSRSPYQ